METPPNATTVRALEELNSTEPTSLVGDVCTVKCLCRQLCSVSATSAIHKNTASVVTSWYRPGEYIVKLSFDVNAMRNHQLFWRFDDNRHSLYFFTFITLLSLLDSYIDNNGIIVV